MKWYRSENNRRLGGICGGISELYNWDVSVIRIVMFVLLFTPVPIVIAYILAWVIIPKKGEIDAFNIHSRVSTAHNSRTKSN
jgi:phage shock protein PspC (stress-responsive transcriptional regulator)